MHSDDSGLIVGQDAQHFLDAQIFPHVLICIGDVMSLSQWDNGMALLSSSVIHTTIVNRFEQELAQSDFVNASRLRIEIEEYILNNILSNIIVACLIEGKCKETILVFINYAFQLSDICS